MEIMKFFVYNPSPPNNDFNLNCNRCHIKTGSPYHTIDCYRQRERKDLKSYFQLSERVNELSQPKPRKQNRKYQQQLVPFRNKAHIFKQHNISSRLDHLAAVKFRKCFDARQQYLDCPSVNPNVIKNLNMHIQRSMYNLYSRLENVKFPKIPDSPKRPAIRNRPASDYEDRLKLIEKLAQPKKILQPEKQEVLVKEYRPIDMALINKLSMPRQRCIKSSDEPSIKPERPCRDDDYYQKLSKPKRNFQAIDDAKRLEDRKTGPIVRTENLAVQWKRLQRKKFRKGENVVCFKVSPNALKYEASEKILKLAVPKTVESDANAPVAPKKVKGGKKKK